MKQKIKRIVAIIGIIVLVGMYAFTIVAAIIDDPKTHTLLAISLVLTVMVPIIIYFILYLLRGGEDDVATKALKGSEEDKKRHKTE